MKKNIKKCCALSLSMIMILSMAACSGKDTSNKTTTEATTASSSEVDEKDVRHTAQWADEAIIYEVNVRQYTKEGTFEAFSTNLQRLKDMGVNTLWFMPIYSISQLNKKGSLGSYYSIQDYTSINSEFGNMEDFKKLVDEAHNMGFTVILDWVANHTGWDHSWITEHPEYYVKDASGNIISPIGQGWDDVAQLDYSKTEVRKAMIDAMKYWITEADIDGFRCDFTQGVPVDFWNEARTELDTLKDIYMLAEDGTQSNSYLISAFDSDYNFGLYDTFVSVAKGGKHAKDLQYKISQKLPDGAFTMNFIENHDKNSSDGSLEERFGKDSIGALTTLIFTLKGAPLIYSGQEEGITKTLEFFEKDQIPFSTYEYAPLLTTLADIKSSNDVLNNNTGADVEIIDNGNDDILVFSRANDSSDITVIINLSDDKQSLNLKDIKGDILLHGNSENNMIDDGSSIDTNDINELNSWEYYVIKVK